MDLREENKTGGRVGKAVGGSLDLAARQKQSQLDFLARQPGAQPAQPQPLNHLQLILNHLQLILNHLQLILNHLHQRQIQDRQHRVQVQKV
jgi:hypothetical protein